MAKIGYARVSTVGQSLDVQLDKLKEQGCERIYKEKASGLDGQRPELMACLDYLREGDTLYVTKLDRMARSTLHLCKISDQLKTKAVNLVIIDQPHLSAGGPVGNLIFNILSSISEFETAIRAERQAEGIAKARDKGIQLGKPKALTDEDAQELRTRRSQGEKIADLMKAYGLSKSSVYNYLRTKPKE